LGFLVCLLDAPPFPDPPALDPAAWLFIPPTANHQKTPLSASQRSSTKIAGCRHQEPISSLPEHPKARLYGLLFISRLRGGRKARLGKKWNTESWGLLFFMRRLHGKEGGRGLTLGGGGGGAVGGRGLRVEPSRPR
jgi:hypothetical protein